MIDVIGFDADDTLWDNEYLYAESKARFISLLEECVSPEECLNRLETLETANVSVYGYGIKSFILSMIEAALELSEDRVAADKIRAILGFARQMLAAEVKLIDGVGEVVAGLAQRYPLMLITKGEASEQQGKIEESGLANYFKWVEIVPDKTPAMYQKLLDRYSIPAGRFLMVGNSLRSDVLPVLRIGGHAVLVHYANTWSHELEVDTGGIEHHALDSLRQLPDYVEQLARGI
jgi:putative hydrolase of the HAD superfamily